MDRNESIIAKWKPMHDKGIYAYVIPYALRYFIALASIVTVIFLINRQRDISTIGYIIAYNMVLFAIVTFGRVIEWYRKEKQYKDILDLFEMANKCPACSTRTTPEDKACPSCGLFLGMDKYIVSVLTEDMAKEICTWKYEGEYSVYNFSDWEDVVKSGWSLSIKEEREREFIGISRNNELIAYGRISLQDETCILGVGLKPSLCGYGYGKNIMGLLIEESKSRYPNSKIALEVRVFNQRAIKCYENIGFEIKYRHIRSMDTGEAEFYYMEYKQEEV